MRPLLLGGTDLTLAVAERMREIGIPPAGVVHVGTKFSISYKPTGVTNVRFADLSSWCDASKIPHLTYDNAKSVRMFAEQIGADFCLAAGWYHMVPKELRSIFPLGTAGLHASLLPRLRGGAPLNWAILSGEKETGITMFALGDGIDDGPLYGQERFSVGACATIGELVQAAQAGALRLVERCLSEIAAGRLKPIPQSGNPSYCLQRIPDDGAIDWNMSSVDIDCLVRAVSRPYPGAFCWFEETKVMIWSSEPGSRKLIVLGKPGQIARIPEEKDPLVVTGDGYLVIHEATDEHGQDLLPMLRRASNRRFRHVAREAEVN